MVDKFSHNQSVFTEIMAIGEKLSYGELDVKLTWHNGMITKAEFIGLKKQIYSGDNERAMRDIADAISKKLTNKTSTDVSYRVKTHKGSVTSIVWESIIVREYGV